MRGCRVIGADTNPLARLIARVKTRPLDTKKISAQLRRINRRVHEVDESAPPSVVNIEHWYKRPIIRELSKLSRVIEVIEADDIREFMQVCLSVCAKRMSLADPRLSVPVRINLRRKEKYGGHYLQLRKHVRAITPENVMVAFNEIVRKNCSRIASFQEGLRSKPSVLIHDEARSLDQVIEANSVDLIITSPPYIGAQKYIRSSSLSLGWLNLTEDTLRGLEKRTIGREHFSKPEVSQSSMTGMCSVDTQLREIRNVNALRAHIAAQYLVEMRQALLSMHKITRENGILVLVIGPNTICGQHFDTPKHLETLANEVGFKTEFRLIDHIRSRGLMTKRNKTAGIIASESVLYLRKY